MRWASTYLTIKNGINQGNTHRASERASERKKNLGNNNTGIIVGDSRIVPTLKLIILLNFGTWVKIRKCGMVYGRCIHEYGRDGA